LLRKQQKNFRKIILRHSVQARCSLLTMSAATAMMSYNGISTRRHPLKLSYPDARINGRTCSFVFCTYCVAWNRLPAANLVFDQVCSQVFDKFVRVCDMLSTRFRLYLSKTWSRTCSINLDMSRLMQQVRSRFVGSCAC